MVFIALLHEKSGEILLCEMVLSRAISTPPHLENTLSHTGYTDRNVHCTDPDQIALIAI